jgi:hypothetical protein
LRASYREDGFRQSDGRVDVESTGLTGLAKDGGAAQMQPHHCLTLTANRLGNW